MQTRKADVITQGKRNKLYAVYKANKSCSNDYTGGKETTVNELINIIISALAEAAWIFLQQKDSCCGTIITFVWGKTTYYIHIEIPAIPEGTNEYFLFHLTKRTSTLDFNGNGDVDIKANNTTTIKKIAKIFATYIIDNDSGKELTDFEKEALKYVSAGAMVCDFPAIYDTCVSILNGNESPTREFMEMVTEAYQDCGCFINEYYSHLSTYTDWH